ncbi:MAG: DUF3500 domain-containing protein [Planctomycetia bacterium]|nr:DUF3500 domain-containing protein [Planctomycetia bacterium]
MDRKTPAGVPRRDFLSTAAGGAAAVAGLGPLWAIAKDTVAETATKKVVAAPESLVKTLFETLTEKQKKEICFAWDHQDSKRGLLRTFVANNWQITRPFLIDHKETFYTDDQRALVRSIFEGLITPEWQPKIDKQLEDDAGGFGHEQSIAIFGTPGEGKYEFVMTGRHMTLRCDGNSSDHVAFGGPIFYGHAAEDFNESAAHTGNVFWPQALAANKLYQMLDGKQQKTALLPKVPREQSVGFRGPSELPGLRVEDMSPDQKEHMQKVLALLVEPYRTSDKDEALAALKAQGGLDKCTLSFYQEGDLGNDKVWDNWRLEGPAFVWHFRGTPHVHVWVNVADDPSVKLNA